MAKLTGQNIGVLSKALADTMDEDELEMFVLSSTGDELFKSYVGKGKPLIPTLQALLISLEELGTTDKFLAEVYEARPDRLDVRATISSLVPDAAAPPRNDAISLSVQKVGVAVEGAPLNAFAPGLQRNVKPGLVQLDLHIWLQKLAQIERRVCRIEFKGNAAGTGFLVGPDAVLTNWHVVEAAKTGNTLDKLTCRFDYQRLENGTRQEGTVIMLHSDGCVDFSPYSPAEMTQTPEVPPPTLEQLDYALLRLSKPVGEEGNRGWIAVSNAGVQLAKNAPLLIVQHPDGAPMKLALDTDSVIDYNANNTRIRYATNTEPGSSGSPCFSMDWELVALHHFGDPAWQDKNPNYNQGVPVNLIRERIIAGGHGALVGMS
jgi:hypothetical protein